jgi:hypothetical protein
MMCYVTTPGWGSQRVRMANIAENGTMSKDRYVSTDTGGSYRIKDHGDRLTITKTTWVPGWRDNVAETRTLGDAYDAIKSDSGGKKIKSR